MISATATATEMQNNFGRYLNMVINGIEVIVTKNGKEIGRCSVYEYESLIDDVFDFLEFKIRKICERGSNNG